MVTNNVGYTVVHMANITSNNFLIDQEGHEVLSEYCNILIGTFLRKKCFIKTCRPGFSFMGRNDESTLFFDGSNGQFEDSIEVEHDLETCQRP